MSLWRRDPDPDRPPRLARRMYKRFAAAFVAIVALSAAATATAGLLTVQDVVDILQKSPKIDVGNQLTRAQAGAPQTLLIFGSDHRASDPKGAGARSDTIMLIRLNPIKGVVTMLSIPRDLKVTYTLPDGNSVTDKINSAYSYGGPKLATKVVKSLLGVPINHVINIDFHFFQEAVNYIGCVYVDVDRRYYHSNAGLPPSEQYSEIDIPAGYQKLCGADALAYVRYRHTDNDLVRAQRQHAFLRDAKQQAMDRGLVSPTKLSTLAKLLARYTTTDSSLRSKSAVLQLLELMIFSTRSPLQTVSFPVSDLAANNGEYVISTPRQIRQAVHELMDPSLSKPKVKRAHHHKHHHHHHAPAGDGLVPVRSATENLGIQAVDQHAHIPVFYPQQLAGYDDIYPNHPPNDPNPRVYKIHGENGKKYHAYRMIFTDNLLGQYYGVQGTDWTNPPILANPSAVKTINGRRLLIFDDGQHIRMVGFHTPQGYCYWVSNTLSDSLTNTQMMGLAESLTDRYR